MKVMWQAVSKAAYTEFYKNILGEFIFNSIIYKFILQMSFSVIPDKLLTTNELHSQILAFVMEM